MISPLGSLDDILIGNDAAWLLSFSKEGSPEPPFEISRWDYNAEIKATLPGGLEGGVYTFVVEGMTDDDYGKIAQGKGQTSPDRVKLFLFWRDTNSSVSGYLTNIAGLGDTIGKVKGSDLKQHLVADLAIRSVTRKAGSRRYEAHIEAQEKVFAKLASENLCSPMEAPVPLDAARAMAEEHGVTVQTYPLTQGPDQAAAGGNPGTEEQQLEVGRTVADILKNQLAPRMEDASGKYGRGMLLIRDGVLHIGPRKFPVKGEVKDLYLATGLLETETLAPLQTDPGFDPCADPTQKAPTRRQFKLTLKGRPDLKPGDVVRFDSPPEEVATTLPNWTGVVGDLFGGPLIPSLDDSSFQNPVQLYVSSVQHTLGRKSGFFTTVSGVELESLDAPWDTHTRRHDEQAGEEGSDGTGEGRAARGVERRVRSVLREKRFAEVAEVRAVNSTGSAEPPSQTVDLWRGLAPADGRRNRARRLAVQRPSPSPAAAAAYLAPFAWGKCGLVLPRYPGTRVLVTHRHGDVDDPIDIGALWESGHGPDSQPGDWWLILPVGVPQQERSTLADDATPAEHAGKVTQDLIDADGRRIIEVGELTIRVGADSLRSAGTRPQPGEDSQWSGTQIIIKSDGSVVIKTSGKNIELDAGSGDITMKANNVNVQVQGKMDVS
jgi:hypothetical protein